MQVTIQLYATFRTGRFKQERRDVAQGIPLRQIVAELGIVEKEIGMSLVNGRHARLDQALSEGDEIYLFPMLTGG